MARISLKDLASLQSALKLKAVDAATLKAKFRDDSKRTANPSIYGANETYVQINELGPVVEDLVDGVKALEDEMEHLHDFLAGQLGRDADKTVLYDNTLDPAAPGGVEKAIVQDATFGTYLYNGNY